MVFGPHLDWQLGPVVEGKWGDVCVVGPNEEAGAWPDLCFPDHFQIPQIPIHAAFIFCLCLLSRSPSACRILRHIPSLGFSMQEHSFRRS